MSRLMNFPFIPSTGLSGTSTTCLRPRSSPRLFPVPVYAGDDAVHVACAEQAGAILLTTDNELKKILKRNANSTSIAVKNPLYRLMEVDGHGTD
jgi:hypothetical protein